MTPTLVYLHGIGTEHDDAWRDVVDAALVEAGYPGLRRRRLSGAEVPEHVALPERRAPRPPTADVPAAVEERARRPALARRAGHGRPRAGPGCARRGVGRATGGRDRSRGDEGGPAGAALPGGRGHPREHAPSRAGRAPGVGTDRAAGPQPGHRHRRRPADPAAGRSRGGRGGHGRLAGRADRRAQGQRPAGGAARPVAPGRVVAERVGWCRPGDRPAGDLPPVPVGSRHRAARRTTPHGELPGLGHGGLGPRPCAVRQPGPGAVGDRARCPSRRSTTSS